MIVLDGKATAQTIRQELKEEVAGYTAKGCRAPGLAVVLVGDDPASQVYVRFKERACEEIGVRSEAFRMPADTAQADLEKLVGELNDREDIDGILVQLPLPKGLDENAVLQMIRPDKDVDGFHPVNVGKLSIGLDCLKPCTPWGCMLLLQRYGLSPAGRKAVVVGRSNIVGKPLAMLLSSSAPYGNATVTVCHSRTENLAEVCREADFLFSAIGRPNFITGDMVKEGAVVVDVGINRVEEGLVGDCEWESVSARASAATPVPGGVGPMTIATLMSNTVQAYRDHEGLA